MTEFKCPECKATKEVQSVTIKMIEGEIRHDVKCDKCDSWMKLAVEKTGCAGFTSNQFGQL